MLPHTSASASAVVRLALLALWALGCHSADAQPTPREPPAAPTSAAAIPAIPLKGQLLGGAFSVQHARWIVDRRPGYERLDLKLYDAASPTPCGTVPAATPSVWLRRRGAGPPSAQASMTTIEQGGTWEVHYQLQKDGRWLGSGEANALVVVERVLPDLTVEGELSACFLDATGSCVAGHFKAEYCPITIDSPVRGAEVMERLPEAHPAHQIPTKTLAHGVTANVDPRSDLLPTYPCSRCHKEREANPTRRKLREFHVVRNSDFSHGEDAFWCYQCHAQDNIDRLRTATGEMLSFDEAYRICLSCHGDKKTAWEGGTHGLILGDWNGLQHKKSCPACHDPHKPKFPLMQPLPPPEPVRGASHG